MTLRNSDRILVVDDEPVVRLVGADALIDAGFDVLEAENADEALRILEDEGAVRLLFTDVRMPGSMDGLELATRVHQRWPEVRILVTSGDRFLSNDQIPDAGEFLAKPYSIHILRERVQALLTA